MGFEAKVGDWRRQLTLLKARELSYPAKQLGPFSQLTSS